MQTTEMITFINSGGDQVTDTIANYIDTTFGYQYSFRWPALVISLLYIMLLRIIIVMATKFLHFDKR